MSRNRIDKSDFRDTFIHEFFHVLQHAHNSDIGWARSAAGPDSELWFVEASADWAAAHFDRTIIDWPARWAGRQADTAVFEQFGEFQSLRWQRLPLNLSVPNDDPRHLHEYMAFIWPYFMEQQTGGPEAIANAWRAIESATTWDQAFAAIDAQLSFADNFHLFAIRNFNSDFDGQNPIGTRYQRPRSAVPRRVGVHAIRRRARCSASPSRTTRLCRTRSPICSP